MRPRRETRSTGRALGETLERLVIEDDLSGVSCAIDERRHHWWCLDPRCWGCAVERGGW